MSYPAYSEYKDSGIEWLGEIPEHWEVKKLKHICNIQTGNTPPTSDEENYADEGTPWVKPDHLKGFELITNTERCLSDIGLTKARPVKKGAVLVCCIGSIGKFGIAGRLLTTNQQINSLTFNTNICHEGFPKYLIASMQRQHEVNANGNVVFILNTEKQGNLFCSFPTKEEQKQIADFLDHETAKIDPLIDKSERLISLLREKRQAMISHAVTKGLNPNVPMRDSGIEWLGEIPEHWGLKRLKYIFEIKKRIAGATGHDILSITQKGIKVKDIESGEGQLSMDYSKYQIVKKGDFAMNHMDLLTGFVDLSNQQGVTSPDYRVFSLRNKTDFYDRYYLYLLQKGYIDKIFYGYGQGASHLGRWRFPTDEFKNLSFPVPPEDEQRDIVENLENELNKMQELESKAKLQVEKLKEHRSALISAAVTGKIDARQWNKKEKAA